MTDLKLYRDLERQKLSMHLNQKAVEANGKSFLINITEGVNQGKILGHKKTEVNKCLMQFLK